MPEKASIGMGVGVESCKEKKKKMQEKMGIDPCERRKRKKNGEKKWVAD